MGRRSRSEIWRDFVVRVAMCRAAHCDSGLFLVWASVCG
jgi:hypothetical protein